MPPMSAPPRPRTPLSLVILSLACEEPMHPYRMQTLIKERGKDQIANVAQRNSIYQTIDALQRAGLIRVRETERDERRPERTIYEATDEGRRTVLAWLRTILSTPAREFPDFPAALSLAAVLGPKDLAELLEGGQHLSGPAATRAVTAVQALPRFLTPSDERRLRRRKDLVIYDNAAAIALCVYDEATALCGKRERPGSPVGPTLVSCVDGCPNCAWTDSQLARLTTDAASLRAQAELAPKPLAQSMVARAEHLEHKVQQAQPARSGQAPS